MCNTTSISGFYRHVSRKFFHYRLVQGVCFSVFIFLSIPSVFAQRVTLYTNTVDWLTLSPNLGAEFSLTPRISLNISAAGSPFVLGKDIYLKHFRIQPEIKYWFQTLLAGHYIGVTATYTSFDLALKNKGYYGDALLPGLTYGYSWILSRRWNMEVSAGIGVVHYRMARYAPGTPPGEPNESGWMVAPVKLAFSFIYVLK